MSELDAETFFETWLPESYATFTRDADLSSLADCTLLAEVGDDSWTVSVESARLSVVRGSPAVTSTFRVKTTRSAFERLLPDPLPAATQNTSALRLLKLDEETCRLMRNVPGALSVRVSDGEAVHEVVVGPGNADFANPGCSITCALEDLQQVQRGNANPMDLFMGGKLTLDGNIEIAMALGGLLL